MMDNDRLRRAGLAIWATIGLVGLTVAGATFITPLRIEWRSFLALVSCGALMAAAAWFYRSVRNERRLALRLVLLLAYSSFYGSDGDDRIRARRAGRLASLKTFVVAFIGTTLSTIAVSACCRRSAMNSEGIITFPARRARHLVRSSTLAREGHQAGGARAQRGDAGRNARLWQPLFRRRDRRDLDCCRLLDCCGEIFGADLTAVDDLSTNASGRSKVTAGAPSVAQA